MEIHLKIIGVLLIMLGLIHAFFPHYFKWKTELHSLSLMNRQMMFVHSFFIGLTVCLMGVLCLISSTEIVGTTLGKQISLGFGLFWMIRLIVQLFIYSPMLWKGKMFETWVHIVFTLLWAYLTIIFFLIYIA